MTTALPPGRARRHHGAGAIFSSGGLMWRKDSSKATS
jgi:hypothetical protein